MQTTDKRCSRCPGAIPILVLTPEIRHYGKFVCPACTRFLTWARDPRTNANMQARQAEILEFVLDNPVSADELKFLFEIYGTAHLNLIQKTRYENILMGNAL